MLKNLWATSTLCSNKQVLMVKIKKRSKKTIRGYYNNAIISSNRNRVDSSVARQDLLTTSYKNKSRSNQLQAQSNVENVERITKNSKIEKPR